MIMLAIWMIPSLINDVATLKSTLYQPGNWTWFMNEFYPLAVETVQEESGQSLNVSKRGETLLSKRNETCVRSTLKAEHNTSAATMLI